MTEIVQIVDQMQSLPYVQAIFVKAELDEVAAYYRGMACHMLKDPDLPPGYELQGEAAGIKQLFGPETSMVDGSLYEGPKINWPNYDWLPERFPLRGFARLSQVGSNPAYVMVENYCNIYWPYLDNTLHDWSGAEVYRIWSAIGLNPCCKTPERIVHTNCFPDNGFSYFGKDGRRDVSATKDYDRYIFTNNGPHRPFENLGYYKKRLVRDRVNRKIMCEYMLALGIDPVSTFVDRDLLNPILFTSDHEGQECSVYVSECERYEEFQRKQFLL